MVVLTKIYTRTGDDGSTGLGDGERLPKYHTRIAAYGTVDEANAAIGVARQALTADDALVDAMLARIQNDLFDLGADLCTPQAEAPKHEPLRVTDEQVARLEREIDEEQAALSRQAALVAWLAAQGQSTTMAESVLSSIEMSLVALLAHRELVLLERDHAGNQ